MPEEKSNVDQRIQNSIYGTPKLKPDEQRHYLGTFRERVWLTISVQEAKEKNWASALKQELELHPDSLVIVNGNLADQLTSSYIMTANQMNAQFTIKTGTTAKTGDDDLAVVVCNHEAVYESPVDVAKKYGHHSTDAEPEKSPHPSFFKRLFHF